jgi:hypothetical protein
VAAVVVIPALVVPAVVEPVTQDPAAQQVQSTQVPAVVVVELAQEIRVVMVVPEWSLSNTQIQERQFLAVELHLPQQVPGVSR